MARMFDPPKIQATDGELPMECARIEVDGKDLTDRESLLAALYIRRLRALQAVPEEEDPK